MTDQIFEYAPAPESRAIVDIAPSYGLFIDGEFREAAEGKVFKTVSPATEEVLSEVAQAGADDVEAAVKAARAAFTGWSALPGAERAKYIFRIARILQERARELAVLETLDNGKPIRETRDADLPLVAAHFFYYAGWADKLAHAGHRPRPEAARRGRPGHPVELPAADAGLEDRPRAGHRQHRRAQAGRDDAALARSSSPTCAARPVCPRASSTSSPATARRAPSWSHTRASTRWPSPAPRPSARRSPARSPARARRSRSNWAARAPTSSSTTPRSTRPSRASSTASTSTRARSAARARGCWCRSRWRRSCCTR